ncbi:MAG TPA: 6-phosphogluconolactonase [Xanthobacteraceae bacterium]|nr:6-phosphogluconolactonase [Xanthobacteraceae bacterium]
MSIPVHRFSTLAAHADAAANAVAAAVAAAIAAKGAVVLAVAGGSTARHVLPRLAQRTLAWEHVVITLTDERWVPPQHSDSNETLVRKSFVPASAPVIGLYTAGLQPQSAIRNLQSRIRDPDVVLLGMGEDGHIASLFPGDPANEATGRFAVVRRPDHVRVTLTPAAMAEARIVLAFTGAAKAEIFDRALADGPPATLPVRHVLRPGTEVFIGP